MYRYLSFVAVAPMYDREPKTPAVYSAARERIAGLRKNNGLRVAAWQTLKPYAHVISVLVFHVKRIKRTNQPECVLQDGVLRGGVHGTHHGTDATSQTNTENDPRIRRHEAEGEAGLEE